MKKSILLLAAAFTLAHMGIAAQALDELPWNQVEIESTVKMPIPVKFEVSAKTTPQGVIQKLEFELEELDVLFTPSEVAQLEGFQLSGIKIVTLPGATQGSVQQVGIKLSKAGSPETILCLIDAKGSKTIKKQDK